MATVQEIHESEFNRGGWVIFFEGVAQAFTNIVALAGSGAGSWIGEAYGVREVCLGLDVPQQIDWGKTNPWSGKILQPKATNFGLADPTDEGEIRRLFKDFEPDETTDGSGGRISPLDDPVAAVVPGLDGIPINVRGRHIGTEKIGPNGERRWLWIAPADAPPGLDHFAGPGWPPSLVTDEPVVWPGRNVALYRIVQDPDTQTWPSWADQYAGGSLLWYGKIAGRGKWGPTATTGRQYQLPCIGQASWLQKSANLSRPTRWYKPRGTVNLEGDRAKIAAWIEQDPGEQVQGDGVPQRAILYLAQTLQSGASLAGLTTKAEIAERVNQVIQCMAADADQGPILAANNKGWIGPNPPTGGDPWYDGDDARSINFAPDGATITIKAESETTPNTGRAYAVGIALDATVWQLLGWDVNTTLFSRSGGTTPVGGANWGEAVGDQALPDYHWIGRFDTRDGPNPPPEDWTNKGQPVSYTAPWQGGTITLDTLAGDLIRLAVGEVPCARQYAQPYTAGATIDGQPVDSSGWWVFRGPLLTVQDLLAGGKPRDATQVAFCEWRATSDGAAIEVDGSGYATMRVLRWEDPRAFGIDDDRFTEPWVAQVGSLQTAPLGVLGGIVQAPGWRHRLIPRTLVSSGTVEWADNGQTVTITPGANHPPELGPGDPYPGDVGASDMGLCIPAAFVDTLSWQTCCAGIPGGLAGALNRVRYPVFGARRIHHILQEAMRGAGLGWTWKRAPGSLVPAFGCYDPLRALSPDDAELTLTRDDIAELSIADELQWSGVLEERDGGPYDRVECSVDRNPLEPNSLNYDVEHESRDFGRRYRGGRITWPVEDGGLRDPRPWLGTAEQDLYLWEDFARTRFAGGVCVRFARQHRIYRAAYNARFAGRLLLGTVVRVKDPTVEAPDGSRGIDHMGRVIEASLVARGEGAGTSRVAIELESKGVQDVKVYGPSAICGVNSWNSATNTLTISVDWADAGQGHDDTLGFMQPAWSDHDPGPLRIAIYQSKDGREYLSSFEVRADVIAADPIAHTLTLDNITGPLLRDMIKWVVAAPYDELTVAGVEWPLAIYTPITRPDGTWDGANKGTRIKT